MKKNIFIIVTTSILTLCACDKVYINGELDGMWNLHSVESDGTTIYPEAIYYSFQRHLTQISKHYDIGLPLRYLGNLRYTGDSVIMWGFYIHPLETHAATLEDLAQFHIYNDTAAFKVNRLNEEMLILQEKERIYTLYKW